MAILTAVHEREGDSFAQITRKGLVTCVLYCFLRLEEDGIDILLRRIDHADMYVCTLLYLLILFRDTAAAKLNTLTIPHLLCNTSLAPGKLN